jgi:hypothetical protein
VKRLAARRANIRRIRRHPAANQPALLIHKHPASLLTSIQPPRIQRTVLLQLSLPIQRRRTTMSRRRHRREIILRLRREHILQARDSMIAHAMIADSAVVADAVAVTVAETVVAIAEAAGSVVEADAIAEAARKDEIYRHRNMRRHRVRRARLIRRIHLRDHSLRAIARMILPRPLKDCRQLFCPANLSRNIRNGRQ